MLETDAKLYEAEAALLVLLIGGLGLALLVRALTRREPGLGLGLGWVAATAFGARALVALSFPLLGSWGDDLRADDDQLFLNYAVRLSEQPLGDAFWRDAFWGDFHVTFFAAQIKLLAGAGGTPLRITHAAVAAAAILLVVIAVNQLGGRGPALATGWFLALEPSSVLFTTILQKETLVLLGEGMLVLGLARSWARRDLSGVPLVLAGASLVLLTRAYAGAFLLAAAVVVYAYLLWSGVGPDRRRHTSVALALAGALAIGMVGAAVGADALDRIQSIQSPPADANTNLQLDPVDFKSPGGLATGVPTRVFDFMFRPFPWQAENASQVLGVIGTMITWCLYALLALGLWRTRREGFARVAPLLVVAAALVLGYALSTVNAGTGFRHRLHLLVPLAGSVAILAAMMGGAPARALRRGAAVAALTLVALFVAGCGGSGDDEPEPQRGAVPRELLQQDTPRRAVARYLRRLKDRSLPLALAQYEPRVRDAMGLTRFAAALEFGGFSLAGVKPVVGDARRSGGSARVHVRARVFGDRRRTFEFELALRGGRWRIVRDDFTEVAVRRQAEVVEQDAIDPGEEIGPEAKRRARLRVRRYRAAAAAAS